MLALTAVVRPHKADLLCQRLLASGLIEDLSAAECRGYGRQKGHLDSYTGGEYDIDFLPKVLITCVIADEHRSQVVDLICTTARTGRIGDGKIFLVAIERFAED